MIGNAVDPGTMVAGDAADEIFEPFATGGTTINSLEDTAASFDVPRAEWNEGDSGELRSAFAFAGTGGPGGNFDLIIPAGQTLDFNSSSQQFFGGPGGLPNVSQIAINGVLNVRDLTIEPGAVWRVRGNRPITIFGIQRRHD